MDEYGDENVYDGDTRIFYTRAKFSKYYPIGTNERRRTYTHFDIIIWFGENRGRKSREAAKTPGLDDTRVKADE